MMLVLFEPRMMHCYHQNRNSFFFFERSRTKTKKNDDNKLFVIFIFLLLISIITRSTTVSTVKTTTSAKATTLKRRHSKMHVLLWNIEFNLRILVEMFQHRLHLVCHNQLDGILVDFGQLRLQLDEHFQLKQQTTDVNSFFSSFSTNLV